MRVLYANKCAEIKLKNYIPLHAFVSCATGLDLMVPLRDRGAQHYCSRPKFRTLCLKPRTDLSFWYHLKTQYGLPKPSYFWNIIVSLYQRLVWWFLQFFLPIYPKGVVLSLKWQVELFCYLFNIHLAHMGEDLWKNLEGTESESDINLDFA